MPNGVRPLKKCTAGKFKDFDFDVEHVFDAIKYCEELAAFRGFTLELVPAGCSGTAQVLRGAVDLAITPGGDRAMMWDATPAAAFGRVVNGFVCNGTGEPLEFDLSNPALNRGWSFSRSISEEQAFPAPLRALANETLVRRIWLLSLCGSCTIIRRKA